MTIKSSIKSKTAVFSFFFLCLSLYISPLRSQDTLKNLPELSLPLASEKLVIAHNMTDIIRFKY
ncbi:MAG: hypothetical protein JSV22_04605, partial [Bacteroidales bacterium]